jgi:chaperonin GroEL (HSP60 family)
VEVRGADESDAVSAAERDALRARCRLLVAAGANVVVSVGLVHPVAQQCLAELGVMCVSNAGPDAARALAAALCCPVVADAALLSPVCLGHADRAEPVVLGGRPFVRVVFCMLLSACASHRGGV